METAKIADMKNNLSRYLARVREGAEFTVLDRSTPVARLVPYVSGAAGAPGSEARTDQSAERVDALVSRGIVSPGDPAGVGDWLETHPARPLPDGSSSAVDVLLEMRAESRR